MRKMERVRYDSRSDLNNMCHSVDSGVDRGLTKSLTLRTPSQCPNYTPLTLRTPSQCPNYTP